MSADDLGVIQGLGEMMPEQLWQTTLDPETRALRRLTISDMLQDLQNTSYAHNNSDILTHQLQTYIGQAVRCAGEYIGALSVVYQNPFMPSQADKTLMGIIAAAIGVEEEHKREATVWAQNEAKWRSLIQTSSNLITILEANGTIKYAV